MSTAIYTVFAMFAATPHIIKMFAMNFAKQNRPRDILTNEGRENAPMRCTIHNIL